MRISSKIFSLFLLIFLNYKEVNKLDFCLLKIIFKEIRVSLKLSDKIIFNLYTLLVSHF